MKKDKKNILLIGLDALRSSNLGCYGYKRPTSPNIDKITEQGILFKNAFSTGNQTDPSLTSFFSGLYVNVLEYHTQPSK